jgi:hypothetical protein
MKYTVRMKQAIAPGIVNVRVTLGNASAKNVNAAVAATLAKGIEGRPAFRFSPKGGSYPSGDGFRMLWCGGRPTEQSQNVE